MALVMINGKIVDSTEATVSVWDRGYYFGDGVYEVIQSYAGKLWGVTPHFRRFERSLREIGIAFDMDRIKRWVNEAFAAAKMPDCVIYWQVTRGCELRSHTPGPDLQPQFFLYVKPAPNNTQWITQGISAITYPEIRWKRCDIKSLNLLPNVMAAKAAKDAGAHEALFVEADTIVEGSSSTYFAILGGTLVTRALDHQVLPSVTRQAVLALTEGLDIPVEERPVTIQEAYGADEAFVSSSGNEIRPIVNLDGHEISGGKPGQLTGRIVQAFLKHTRSGGSFDDLVRHTRFALLPADHSVEAGNLR